MEVVNSRKKLVLHSMHLNLNVFGARIAQLVAYRLGTGKVPDSNPGKGENFSVKKVTDLFEFEYEYHEEM